MSLSHSPSIVTNGLVFYYDMANIKKSWKGKPTTNLLYDSGVFNSSFSVLVGTTAFSTITANSKYRITSTTGTQFRFSIPLAKLTNNLPYNLSFKYKIISGGPTFNMGDWCDTGLSNVVNTDFLSYKYSSAYGTRSTYDNTYRFMDFNISANTVVDIWDMQLEQSTFATEFITGTRSNTQSVLDLTNTATITANNLAYTQSNTFDFNGSSSYITLGQVYRYQDNFSIEAVVKFPALPNNTGGCSARHPIVYNHDYGYNLLVGSDGRASWNIYNTVSANATAASTTPVIGNYYHIVGIKSGTNLLIYVNGVLEGQVTLTTNAVYYTSEPFVIGGYGVCGGTRFYSTGNIYKVSVYNTALTAAEVQQNFNATRGRFGI